MATYYVDYLNGRDDAAGTADAPFKTPHRALAVVGAGDTVLLRGNEDEATFYRKPLQINKPLTTWAADEGHTPRFNGGYYPEYGRPKSFELGQSVPGSLYGKMLTIRADGVTLRGLQFEYIGGGGIGVGKGADYTTIEGCQVYYTYGHSLDIGGPNEKEKIAHIVVTNCVFDYSSLAWNAPGQGQKAANGVMVKFADDVLIGGCKIIRSHKEGLNVDKACERVVVKDCVFDTNNHAHVYNNRASDTTITGCLIINRHDERFLNSPSDATPEPVGIKYGDEGKPGIKPVRYPNARRGSFTHNIIIGGSSCFSVPNNPNNYDTQLYDVEVAYNTFIGVRWLRDGKVASTGAVVEIFQNLNGRPHRDSSFHHNVIYAPRGVKLGKLTGVGGIDFHHNCWYSADDEAPPVSGEGDITANPLLLDPEADIPAEGPIALLNYRPGSGSPLVGADGGVIGALEPLPDEPEPPVEWVSIPATQWNRMVALAASAFGMLTINGERYQAMMDCLTEMEAANGQALADVELLSHLLQE